MCFSAPASFIAGGGLVTLGVASFAIAKKEDKILAVIPIIFGVQQLIEGIQWLNLNIGSLSIPAGYGFIFIALIVWPIYVPIAVYFQDKRRRKFLKWFVFLGIAIALYFLFFLLTQTLHINKFNSCIQYAFNFPFKDIASVVYLLSIFGPLFASDREIFKWFGVATAILATIAEFYFLTTFTSVWCFFAAIVSSMFFVYLKFKK